MSVTPKTMARQIVAARSAFGGDRLAYTSQTGVVRPERVMDRTGFVEDHEPHCFVCGRHTDHFAEHDDMVEAGTARYAENGDVFPIPWN